MANKKTSEEDLLVESGYSADGSEEFFRLSKHNGSGGYVNKKTAFLNLANWIKSFFGAAALSNDYNDLDNLPETTAGDNGVHGANALTWGNSGVVVGVPDPTKFIPNSNTATAINSIKIHEQESNEVNVSPWIAALPVGAQLKITEENNHAIFGVYVVDSKTDNGSYWTIGLTNVTGNGVFAGVCVFSYNLTGGTTGAAELVYGDLVQDATDLWKFASTVPGETAYRSDCIYRLSTGGGPVFQSGTNVTVNVNGLGAVDLLTWDGGNITPGTIKSNKHYYAQYVNGALRAVWKGTFGEATITWGNVVGGISNQTDLQTALDDKVTKNAAITGATKTKITYDAKGLVTAGADATTADIAESTDKRYVSDAQEAKIDFLTVTQPVDLDDIETRVNNLDAAVVLKGIWDASAGTFPGGGTAQAGASYIVSVGGTVDGVTFNANDRLIAIADNASATTFASNWFKADYTDQVLSVNGATGAVTITPAGIGAATASHTHTASQVTDFNAAALAAAPAETATTTGTLINTATDKATPVDADYVGLMDSAASNILKKLSWANIKATLKAYFDTLYAPIGAAGGTRRSPVTAYHTTALSPADSTTYYYGWPLVGAVAGSPGIRLFEFPFAGTVTDCAIQNLVQSVLGTAEAATYYLRITSGGVTTDHLLSNSVTFTASHNTKTATGLSIPILAGDKGEIKMVTPVWATNPTNVIGSTTIFIQPT